eukprot:1355710-Rhodomonas_salina.1
MALPDVSLDIVLTVTRVLVFNQGLCEALAAQPQLDPNVDKSLGVIADCAYRLRGRQLLRCFAWLSPA